jgi:2-dehydropantoate 2-reductase
MEGRPSELEAQNGYIAKRGAALGVPVPVNTFIYSVLLPQERRARGV